MKRLQRLLDSRVMRWSGFAFAGVLTAQALAFTICYFIACRYLVEHDPRKVENVLGIIYYARPKVLFVNQEIACQQVIAHLQAIGYQERDGEAPGTFSESGRALTVNARLPEFSSAVIYFQGRKIKIIKIGGENVDTVAIEPPTLVNVIRQTKDDQPHPMNARRFVLQEDALMRSHLYPMTVCAEDRRFAQHNGIDELGVFAAVFVRRRGGGSTLAQQLIKNGVLGDVSTGLSTSGLMRKFKEFFLALAVSREMTKAQLFTAYANHCPLGGGDTPGTLVLYGFGAASQELFGTTDVEKLTLGQAAALAAIIHRPNYYLRAARRGDYGKLQKRRAAILDAAQSLFADLYTPEVIANAKAEPIQFLFASERETEKPLDVMSRHFQRLAAAQAWQQSGLKPGLVPSARIYLTVDPDLQAAARRAVDAHLARLDKAVENARRLQELPSDKAEPVQVALVAIEVQTGEILALVGGRDEGGFFNYATAKRSPGSAIKPYVYLAALTEGQLHGAPFTAASFLHPLTDPVDDYRPMQHPGEDASARHNLAVSGNAAACVVGHCAGLQRAREYIERFTGARSRELTGMLTIGGSAGSEVDLVSLTAGYAALASGGVKTAPTTSTSIYLNGNHMPIPTGMPTRIADASAVYVLTQMLRSVAQPGGTGYGALAQADLPSSAPMAMKSGTGQVADLWFCGYTPKLAIGVWVGMPNNRPTLDIKAGFDGARAALPIWASFIRNGVKKFRPDLLVGQLTQPANVIVLRVNREGCITTGVDGVEEYFIAGREPAPCGRPQGHP